MFLFMCPEGPLLSEPNIPAVVKCINGMHAWYELYKKCTLKSTPNPGVFIDSKDK